MAHSLISSIEIVRFGVELAGQGIDLFEEREDFPFQPQLTDRFFRAIFHPSDRAVRKSKLFRLS